MKLNEIDIKVWDNIIDSDFLKEYVEYIKHRDGYWQFSGAGVAKEATIWFRDLGECELTQKLYKEYIVPRLSADIEDFNTIQVNRVYANAQGSANRSDIHVDAHYHGCYSILLYANLHWPKEFEGETIFYTEDEELYGAVLPKPGRVVVFDGSIPHIGRPPHPEVNGNRITVVYKMVPNKDQNEWGIIENKWNIY